MSVVRGSSNYPRDKKKISLKSQCANIITASDAVAHISEEVKDASIIAPRAMFWSFALNIPSKHHSPFKPPLHSCFGMLPNAISQAL